MITQTAPHQESACDDVTRHLTSRYASSPATMSLNMWCTGWRTRTGSWRTDLRTDCARRRFMHSNNVAYHARDRSTPTTVASANCDLCCVAPLFVCCYCRQRLCYPNSPSLVAVVMATHCFWCDTFAPSISSAMLCTVRYRRHTAGCSILVAVTVLTHLLTWWW